MAAANLMMGKNVLYITMEMAEDKIAERIDANLLNVPLDELKSLPLEIYKTKVAKVKGKTTGKLIIKEYPTAGAGAANFRYLINELNLKKSFVPDVVFIDYLNICCSSRFKMGSGSVNSYIYVKSIAEELRGLAIEKNVVIFTATQFTRGGYDNSDPDMTDTSESFGTPASMDSMFAIITNDELNKFSQVMIKQLKNRFRDVTQDTRFVLGIDRSKMRLYDVEQSAQSNVANEDKPIMSQSSFGQRQEEEGKKFKNFGKGLKI
jgi:hypothetical protein